MFVVQTYVAVDTCSVTGLAGESVETDQIYNLFGARLKAARKAAKLTQEQLAERVGLSRASIANIEAGRQRIGLHLALELSVAVEVQSIADLLPIDFMRPDNAAVHQTVKMSGSTLSAEEAESVARIFASS